MPDNTELLDTELCNCTSIRDVIDRAMSTAVHLHRAKKCAPSQIMHTMMVCSFFVKIFYLMEQKDEGKEGLKSAKEFVHELTHLAKQIDDECSEYSFSLLEKLLDELSSKEEEEVPVGTTIQ